MPSGEAEVKGGRLRPPFTSSSIAEGRSVRLYKVNRRERRYGVYDSTKVNRRERGTRYDSTKVNRRERGTRYDSTKVNHG